MHWRSTTPSSRTAMPRTSRSRRRCNRWCSASASPGTSAGRCGCSATTPALGHPAAVADDRAGARPVPLPDRAGFARGRRLALGGQGDRLLARAQERRDAAGRAHRRHAHLGQCGGRFRMVDGDAAPLGAQGPVRRPSPNGSISPPTAPAPRRATRGSGSSPPTSRPRSAASRRRICSRRRCASSAAR